MAQWQPGNGVSFVLVYVVQTLAERRGKRKKTQRSKNVGPKRAQTTHSSCAHLRVDLAPSTWKRRRPGCGFVYSCRRPRRCRYSLYKPFAWPLTLYCFDSARLASRRRNWPRSSLRRSRACSRPRPPRVAPVAAPRRCGPRGQLRALLLYTRLFLGTSAAPMARGARCRHWSALRLQPRPATHRPLPSTSRYTFLMPNLPRRRRRWRLTRARFRRASPPRTATSRT